MSDVGAIEARPMAGANDSRMRAVLRRGAWIGIDQAVSSLTTAGLTVFVARALGASEFGSFAVAFTLYPFLISISAAGAGAPFAMRWARADLREARSAIAAAVGWPLILGAASGLVVGVAGLLLRSRTGWALVAVAPLLPWMLAQDCLRTALITVRRPRAALLNDAVWAVVQFGTLGALALHPPRQAWIYVLIWGGSATVAALVGLWQTRTLPRIRALTRWLLQHADISLYVGAEAVSAYGASQLVLLGLALISSPAQLGAFRGATALLGPLSFIFFAVGNFVVPEVARRSPGRAGSLVAAAIIGGFAAALAVALGVVLLLLPDSAGHAVLGDTWPATRRLLLPFTAYSAVNMLGLGPFVVLRGLAKASATFVVNATQAPLLIACGLLGAVFDGAQGTAIGLLVASLLTAPLWVVQLRRATADENPAPANGRPRLLVMSDAHIYGGAEMVLINLIDGWRERYDVRVAAAAANPDLHERLAQLGVTTKQVRGLARHCGPWARQRLRRLLRDCDVAVANLTDQGDGSAMLATAGTVGVPTMAVLHLWVPKRLRLLDEMSAVRLQRLARVATSSEATARIAASHGVRTARSIQVAPTWRPPLPAAEARQRLGLDPDAVVVGGLGRLANQKGWDVLVRAAEQVRRHRPDVVFAVIGDGPLADRLQAADGTGAVRWLGAVPNASTLLSAFDLLIMPSRFEGLPLVAIEAGLAGVPVLGTDVPGMREAVGPDGWLIPPDDDAALAAAILHAVSDAARLRRQSAQVKAWTERSFTVGGMVERATDLLPTRDVERVRA